MNLRFDCKFFNWNTSKSNFFQLVIIIIVYLRPIRKCEPPSFRDLLNKALFFAADLFYFHFNFRLLYLFFLSFLLNFFYFLDFFWFFWCFLRFTFFLLTWLWWGSFSFLRSWFLFFLLGFILLALRRIIFLNLFTNSFKI